MRVVHLTESCINCSVDQLPIKLDCRANCAILQNKLTFLKALFLQELYTVNRIEMRVRIIGHNL